MPDDVLNRSYDCGNCGGLLAAGTRLADLSWDAKRPRPGGTGTGMWCHITCPPKTTIVPTAPASPQPAPTVAQVVPADGSMTSDQVRILKSLHRFPDDATPDEISAGLTVAKRLGLDPFRRQIGFIRFEQSSPIEPFTTIDGLQTIAARTGQLAGIDPPQFVEPENQDPADPHPESASVAVYRLIGGQRSPFVAFVRWAEFVKRKKDGSLTRAWAHMPYHMLGKVARAQALRMAFPDELSGVFEEAEAPPSE